MAVTLYRQVGKGKARRYQKVNLSAIRQLTNLLLTKAHRSSLSRTRLKFWIASRQILTGTLNYDDLCGIKGGREEKRST